MNVKTVLGQFGMTLVFLAGAKLLKAKVPAVGKYI